MTISVNAWTLAFCLSLALNVWLFLYTRYLIRILVSASQRVKEYNDEVINFAAHIKGVSELEAYYGDETITGLLKHTLYMVGIIEGFSEIMDITEPSEQELEEQDDSEQDDEAEEEARPQVEKEILYAGTRRRDN